MPPPLMFPFIGQRWIRRTLLRRKRLDSPREQLHSEWDRRLGTFSIAMIAVTFVLVLSLQIILPGLFAEQKQNNNKGNGVNNLLLSLAALTIVSLFIVLGAQQLSFISARIAKNGPLYQMAFAMIGQGPAFWIAWSQLLDFHSLLTLTAHSLSEHTNLLFHNAVHDHLVWSFPSQLSNGWSLYQHQQLVDFFALTLPLIAAMIMCCSLRVLLTVTLVFLVAAIFTSVSTGTVALLHNIDHYLRAKQRIGQFFVGTGSILLAPESDEKPTPTITLLNDGRWLLMAYLGLEAFTFLAEECVQPRRVLPPIFGRTAKAQTLCTFIALLAFFPFLQRILQQQQMIIDTVGVDDAARVGSTALSMSSLFLPLPELLTSSSRLRSAQYLMNVGSVCALCTALLCLFLPTTRILVLLANDRLLGSPLLPKCVGRLAKKGGQPRCAVLIIALTCALTILLVPRRWLVRLLPLNLTLRLIVQAILVYFAYFTPTSSDNFLEIFTQRYRRVHRRPIFAKTDANAVGLEQLEMCESNDDDEDEEDDWDYDSEEDVQEEEDEEEEGPNHTSHRRKTSRHDQLLDRVLRFAGGCQQENEDESEQTSETADTRIIDKHKRQQQSSVKTNICNHDDSVSDSNDHAQNVYLLEQKQITNVAPRNYSSMETIQSTKPSPRMHLPRLQLPQQPQRSQHRHHYQQQPHNCFRSPCAFSSSQTINKLHIYELDTSSSSAARRFSCWASLGTDNTRRNGTRTPTTMMMMVRHESGTRAACTLDEDQAYARAQWALTGIGLLALLSAFSLKALCETREYTPMLALLALLVSLPLSLCVAVWFSRTRVDWPLSTSGTASFVVEQREGGLLSKTLPLGSMCSLFMLVHLVFFYPEAEYEGLAIWNLFGFAFYVLNSIMKHRRKSGR